MPKYACFGSYLGLQMQFDIDCQRVCPDLLQCLKTVADKQHERLDATRDFIRMNTHRLEDARDKNKAIQDEHGYSDIGQRFILEYNAKLELLTEIKKVVK